MASDDTVNTVARHNNFNYTVVHNKHGSKLITIILSNLNKFSIFFTARFCRKFTVKWLLKVPPHLAYVATLPCETLMSENKLLTINYDLV